MASSSRTDRPQPRLRSVQLLGRERRAIAARMASSVAHALGTPLNVIAGRAAMVAMDSADPEAVQKHAALIQDQVRAVSDLSQRLVAFVRTAVGELEGCRLDELTRAACAEFQEECQARGVTLETGGLESLNTRAEPGAWVQLAGALLGAGLACAHRGSSVTVKLERRRVVPPRRERGGATEGEYACLAVSYRAAGLPAAVTERPGEPWWAEPPPEPVELALALAVAYEVARAHRGWTEASEGGIDGIYLRAYWPLCGEGE